jgi:hypothetical protein
MDATVAWTANTDDTVGYKVYHGYRPGEWIDDIVTVLVPTTQATYLGLDDFKTHYFMVTAFDAVPNESGFSATVSKRLAHRLTLK